MVPSKGRQRQPAASAAARLIGCGGRAAAAAAAAVMYTTTTRFVCPFFWQVLVVSVPTALLRASYRVECVVIQWAIDDSVKNHLTTAVE